MVMKEVSEHSGSVITTQKMTKGRQKIEMKKIQETSSRQVTFSKRRIGLFKKAAEISVLIGAEAAIVVSSPGNIDRVFVFGHPNPDLVLDPNQKYSPPPLPMKELNHYLEVSRELEAKKKLTKTIPVSRGGSPWFGEHVDGVDEEEELQGCICCLEELQKKILTRAGEVDQ